MTKQLPGSSDRFVSGTPHSWGGSGNWTADGSKTCSVCGVTLESSPFPYKELPGSGFKFKYTDATGRTMNSMVELSCPAFAVDNGELNERTRRATKRVDAVEDKVESIEERLARLEAENARLQEAVNSKIQLDVDKLIEWLSQMARMHAQAKLPTVPVEVAGLPYEVPQPIADLVTSVAVKVIKDDEG